MFHLGRDEVAFHQSGFSSNSHGGGFSLRLNSSSNECSMNVALENCKQMFSSPPGSGVIQVSSNSNFDELPLR